jgi:hypothetical protein
MENTTPPWRVKAAVGFSMYALALAAGAYEIWNNLENAHDPQSKVVAVLAVVSLMTIPVGLRWLKKGSAGRTVLYTAITLALVLTGWSGIKSSLNSQGAHILAVSDTQKARSSSEADEVVSRQDASDAKKEAASARAEAAKISEVSSVAALAAIVATANDDLAAAKKQAIEYGTICTKRQSCQLVLAKYDTLSARLGQAQAKAEALARADKEDAKAAEANSRMIAAQRKLSSTRSAETAGIDTIIADHFGLQANTVARYDGLIESLWRLGLILALSLMATPASLLISDAWAPKTEACPSRLVVMTEIITPSVRMAPADIKDLAILIVDELRRNGGRVVGQNKLARMIAQRHGIPVAPQSVSDRLVTLEEGGIIARQKAGDGVTNIIDLAEQRDKLRA